MMTRFLDWLVAVREHERKWLCSECRETVVQAPALICGQCLGVMGFAGLEGLIRSEEQKETVQYGRR